MEAPQETFLQRAIWQNISEQKIPLRNILDSVNFSDSRQYLTIASPFTVSWLMLPERQGRQAGVHIHIREWIFGVAGADCGCLQNTASHHPMEGARNHTVRCF